MPQPKERPEGVHPDARWEDAPGWEWVYGELDENGERHGEYLEWHRDGYLHGKCSYVHGKIDGPNENYHPDGKVASIGWWKMGVQHGGEFHRAECESPEPWPSVGDAVWKIIERSSEDGSRIITFEYYDREGTRIGMDGEPLPPRPKGLPDTARWFPQHDFWVDGATLQGTATQVGSWKWWSREGELQREEERRDDGSQISIHEYEDGRLDKKSIYDEEGVRRDHWSYRDDGTLLVRRKKNADGKNTLEEWYDTDGSVRESTETEWDDDAIVMRKQSEGGVLLFEAKREGQRLLCTLYRESGTLDARGALELRDGDTFMVGTWTLFDEKGEVELKVEPPKPMEADPHVERLPWRIRELAFEILEPKIPAVPQLAGVPDLDWGSFEGAYNDEIGSFPRFLRALVSDNARVRRYGMSSIYSEALHQGTVYECTARVMPFVIDLLDHPSADLSELLEMIHDFASNAAPWVEQARGERAERDANAPPPGVQAPGDDEPDWTIGVLGTVDAVGERWSKLWALMDSDDEAIRRTVLSLASLPEPNDDIRDALRGLATSSDETPQMRAVAIEAISNIDGASPDDLIAYFEDDSPLVRATAAIQCGLTFGPGCPDEVVDALAMALEKRDAVASDYHELPFVDIHYLARLALAVGSIGSRGNSKARALTLPLCERIEDVDGSSAPLMGRGLLALVLGSGERPFGKDFMHVLETLAKSKKFNTFNVNASEILQSWNLPGFDLGDFVDHLKQQDDPEAALHAHMHDA